MSKLREARKAAGITQEQLALALNINRATISKYENGTIDIPVQQAKAISRILGIDWKELYPEDKQGAAIAADVIERAGLKLVSKKDGVDGRIFLTKESMDRLKERTSEERKKESEEIEAMLAELEAEKDAPSELKILQAYHKLNLDGQQKAVERVQELTEIPRYQATATPQSTPAPQEGEDVAPPSDTPETPPEDE